MLKIHLVSDLHIEMWSYDPSNWPEADIYILAGDIANRTKEIPIIPFDKPVLLLPGNHEYYDHIFNERDDVVQKWLAKRYPNYHYMSPRRVFIKDDVWFICTPLWSDCRYDSMPEWQYHAFLQRHIHDFKSIRYREDEKELRFLHPMDYVLEYRKNREWVIAQINVARLGGARKVIVVTHFSPDPAYRNPKFDIENNKYVPYFCASMGDVIKGLEPDYWFFGHTHHSCDTMEGQTRIVSNPRGHPGTSYSGNSEFNNKLIMEV